MDLDRLATLERSARRLQTGADRRAENLSATAAHAEQFLATLDTGSVYRPPPGAAETISALALSDEPAPFDEALHLLNRYVDGFGHNLGSGRFFAYIPSGSLNEAALADYLAAVSNRYAGVGFAAPGATRMDQVLLQWLASVVGYPATSEGDLTSGASLAALSAIVTAREAHALTTRDIPKSVVYLTSQTHHTFAKALRIAGLGECVIRQVEMDHGHRMRADGLAQAIEQDRKRGLKPWFVCVTAGTTNLGAVDPLDAIADIAADSGCWLHADAAYGGAFALCAEGRRRLQGIERTDSLILDPHKGLFIPCGTGVLLVREGQKLYEAFQARGEYMQDLSGDERSPCDLSPELTRPFRALRIWLPLKVHGISPFAAALEEKLLLAQYFYEQVQRLPYVDVGERPDLSIVPFRCDPDRGDADEFNRRIVEEIMADGRVFLTSTQLDGRNTLRMAILNYMSHKEEVDLALTVLSEVIARISSD